MSISAGRVLMGLKDHRADLTIAVDEGREGKEEEDK